jgi:hypothetical protein
MTTISLHHIHSRLDEAHQFRKRLLVGEKLSAFLILMAGMLLAFTLPGGFLEFPATVRWLMLAGWGVAAAAGGFLWVVVPLHTRWNRQQMARRIEQSFPGIKNGLINSVQLGQRPEGCAAEFLRGLFDATVRASSAYNFQDAFSAESLKRLAAAAAVLVLALGVYGAVSPRRFRNGLTQVFRPSTVVAVDGFPEFVVEPGNQAVFHGEDLTVRASITAAPQAVDLYDARILVESPTQTLAGQGDTLSGPRDMVRSEPGKFVAVLKEISAPFTYRVEVGRKLSEPYQVTIARRPEVAQIQADYYFPAYTRLELRSEKQSSGHLKAVKGTEVKLTVSVGPSGKQLRGARIEFTGGSQSPEARIAADGQSFETAFTIEKDDSYIVQLLDSEGFANKDLVRRTITAVTDGPPKVAIKQPGQNLSVAVGETVPLRLEATDDFGLADLFVLLRVNDTGATQRLVGWQEFPDPRLARVAHPWFIDPEVYKPGDTVRYHAEAMDTNPQQATASSGEFVLRITDPEKALADKQKTLTDWEAALQAVLKTQRKARAMAGTLAEAGKPDDPGESVFHVRQLQVEVHTRTKQVADEMSDSAVRTVQARKALSWLLANGMAEAIRLAELARTRDEPGRTIADLRALIPVQDTIIATLEKILDLLPRLANAPETPEPSESAGDLPDDSTGEDAVKLAEGLKDFIDEQRKVIENTADLAKQPVDDFTGQQDGELRKLEAKEDRWSDFMKDAFSDLSKVPEQDFANPSMLKELLEIQSEIEMAKDALAQKATEIATPLEENGAELAEAMTTHLEKWLPETPDRDKWQMEEPLGEYETPMAELPKEMEDIVGDLMEAEEDLFEEMEDTTSSWADSLDKGAGWDAMDGPISNMSAQGVTGNRLPNTSEIGGRSGEGRSGKSSGEFVEEEATGKGGRRTPTRLTPDPFESGSIKDSAPEAGGGSTGGGKESGAGSEGLEGPAPDVHQREIKALAQRQAELRNRAEKIKLQLQVSNFPALFEDAVKSMAAVEDDLRSGRYQDAFRKRAVLIKRLDSARDFMANEVQIRRDTTTTLPVKDQEMILDAMNGPVPRGYEDALKTYYQAIAK